MRCVCVCVCELCGCAARCYAVPGIRRRVAAERTSAMTMVRRAPLVLSLPLCPGSPPPRLSRRSMSCVRACMCLCLCACVARNCVPGLPRAALLLPWHGALRRASNTPIAGQLRRRISMCFSCGWIGAISCRAAGAAVSVAGPRSTIATNWQLVKKCDTLLDLCVSSLRRGHANLLCIVPILTDDLRRGSDFDIEGAQLQHSAFV